MGLKEDILEASKKVGLNPYNQVFKPSDLGLTSSDYGSFSDYCSKDDTLSGQWSSKIILKVAERNKSGKPHKYFLIDQQ